MKNTGRLLLLILAIASATGFYSCDKKTSSDRNAKGMAEFSFNLDNQVKAAKSGTPIAV